MSQYQKHYNYIRGLGLWSLCRTLDPSRSSLSSHRLARVVHARLCAEPVNWSWNLQSWRSLLLSYYHYEHSTRLSHGSRDFHGVEGECAGHGPGAKVSQSRQRANWKNSFLQIGARITSLRLKSPGAPRSPLTTTTATATTATATTTLLLLLNTPTNMASIFSGRRKSPCIGLQVK